MKKIFILLIILMFASASFAAWTGDSITVAGTEDVSLSKNVKADYTGANPATSGGTDYQTYSAATYSAAGTKAFGGASGLSVIKYQLCTDKDCTKNAPTTPISAGDSGDFSSGWSDL